MKVKRIHNTKLTRFQNRKLQLTFFSIVSHFCLAILGENSDFLLLLSPPDDTGAKESREQLINNIVYI